MLNGVYKQFQHWARQTVWIYSDPHFSDIELKNGFKDRPSDEEQVKAINSCVGRLDTIIFLGDIGNVDVVKQIKGYKVLICGNHDSGIKKYEEIFDEVYTGALIIGEKLILSHEPVDIPWLFNIHGHDHNGTERKNHLNVCSDVVGYQPVNLNRFLKTGPTSKIKSIHRETIDKAIERKNNNQKTT